MKHLISAIFFTFLSSHALAQISVSGAELSGRRLLRRPAISAIPSDFAGDVTVRICVDSSGLVTQADFQPQSSDPAPQLVQDRFEELACMYKFARSTVVLACGDVRFSVKKE